MRAKRVIVSPEMIEGGVARLDDKLRRHLRKVMRLDVGATLELADGHGCLYRGAIEAFTDNEVLVRIEGEAMDAPEPRPRITLIVGLTKGARSEWVMQKATELGASRIIPAICERSIARPRSSSERKHRRWAAITEQAARQSGRWHLPALEPICPLADALDGARGTSLGLIAATRCKRPLGDYQGLDQLETIALAIGPEGGLTDAELALAADAGFEEVSLGPLVLRAETAAITLLAIVAHLSGRLAS